MNRKHFNNSRTIKRTLVIILSAALLVGFTLAQATPPPAQPSVSPSPSAQPTTSAAAPSTASPTPQAAAPQPPKKQSHPGKRDLSLYDKSTPLTLSKNASKQERESGMSQVRRFLFEHWQGKHHGYVQTFHPDIAGNAVTSVFFIEPDAKGQWAITIERADSSETFYFVEQVSVPNDGTPPRVDPDGKVRGSGGTGLYLKQNAKAHSGLIL